ncbi:MAG: hypothetical protein KatS3mg076_1352 [Candidatus Binatia bacterium]|nr:MAG: hypothetical protein KatS3mg076_1352 [Candidatus Binatia bacterium]
MPISEIAVNGLQLHFAGPRARACRAQGGEPAPAGEQGDPHAPGHIEVVRHRHIVEVQRRPERLLVQDRTERQHRVVRAHVARAGLHDGQELDEKLWRLDMRRFGEPQRELPILNFSLPFDDHRLALKWDGEWHITIEVFRDLGVAFGAVLVLIYGLMVGWFGSFVTPLIVMAVIPFSLIGILPAHGALGAFFTATSMIGFMAGAGIVVRNSIILVDFIELRRAQGLPLDQAVVEAGAVRFRPMLLTAMAVVVGAAVILFDPIFQGLAVSLMAGEVASLLISRMAVPLLYYSVQQR